MSPTAPSWERITLLMLSLIGGGALAIQGLPLPMWARALSLALGGAAQAGVALLNRLWPVPPATADTTTTLDLHAESTSASPLLPPLDGPGGGQAGA